MIFSGVLSRGEIVDKVFIYQGSAVATDQI